MYRTLFIAATMGLAGSVAAAVDGPGDYRGNYDSESYETRARPLAERVGQATDLVARAKRPHLGLPPLPVPADNPITRERVELGRKLFFDRRLSLNGTQSCAMCHIPEQGFTNNEIAIAVGFEGRSVGRNTPSLYNAAYKERLFHDAREISLENQSWQPMIHPNEMAMPSIGAVLERLRLLPDYQGLFEAAFDGRGPSMETVSQALAGYQRTLIAANSPFDRWRYGGDEGAVDEPVKRGFALFTGKAACAACHTIGEEYAVFTDHVSHNTGIGYAQSQRIAAPQSVDVLVAPGVRMKVDVSVLEDISDKVSNDLGRYRITGDPDDRWKFKTPTLRNVALTAPYMHDGSLGTLEEVVRFYNRGGEPNENLDPLMRPLNLSEQEQADLVAFLRALTGEYQALVRDAFAAPVGDMTHADAQAVHFGKDYTPVQARGKAETDLVLRPSAR